VIRAFIAVDLQPQVIEQICQAISDLKHRIPGIRWIAPQNFHVTLKFLGDIEETQIGVIGAALADMIGPFPRLTINAKGLGVFPDLRRPRILWVGLTGNTLPALAARVQSALEPLSFAAEQRPFTPHLTIGRWRQIDRPPKTLSEDLARWRDREFGEFLIDRVTLYRSVLKSEGATYQALKVVALDDKRSSE
jgi:RNA 2',3'-cyclic 3'-phosphodiesterase